MTYDSLQFVANKRWAKGVTINASYTWVPRWTEDGANTTTGIGNAYVDEVSLLQNTAPYFSQRKHRITASGVWELPWFRNERSVAGYLLGGWSIAPAFVFQSGQPWDMPGNVDLAPGVDPKDIARRRREARAVHLRRQAVRRPAERGDGQLRPAVRVDGVRLHRSPYFLIRETFQRRTAMFRYDEFRRPIVLAGRHELREDARAITDTDAVPDPPRGVQPVQQPDVRRAQLQPDHDAPRTSAGSTATRWPSRTSSDSSSWDSASCSDGSRLRVATARGSATTFGAPGFRTWGPEFFSGRSGSSSRRFFTHNRQMRVLALAAALGLAGGTHRWLSGRGTKDHYLGRSCAAAHHARGARHNRRLLRCVRREDAC